MRTIAIGDIHGCLDELKFLIDKIDPKSDDSFIFLGDYIDRGKNSKGVIDFLIEFNKKHSCVFLRGNHEDMLLRSIENDRHYYNIFLNNGGGKTLDSFGIKRPDELPEEYVKFFKDTLIYHFYDKWFFAHAGVLPNMSINELLYGSMDEIDVCLWVRNEFIVSKYKWEKIIVYGHTPFKDVNIQDNKIGVDTGCVYENRLSAIDVETNEIFSVKFIKKIDKIII